MAMMFLQSATNAAAHDVYLMRICAVVIAAALVAQAVGVLLAASYAAKMMIKLDKVSKSLEEKTTPILTRTNDLLRDLAPKIHSVSTNVEQMTYTVRAKVDELAVTVSELNETVSEMNGRTRRQVVRVDGIVTEALMATQEISQTVQQGIRGPVRQIVGVVAGVQAAIATLLERSPFGKRERPGPFDL
jgi:methyl-accepting chemotaxis protein